MKSTSVEAQQARHFLLTELKAHQSPISLQELELNLDKDKLSHRTIKEAAWRLVEEGKAQFNSTWDLEIRCD